ncbi:MAG: hypothetical protein IPL55_20050 [Saprospiraceae bacterium]|jgi:hypothetical protein|nr:hypothetical protein [Saprospiraceae bacterium]MBL0025541.1 hypothetical protein [Saprospiraceae bacterium]
MNYKFLILLAFTLSATGVIFSQVKIGDNPTTINPNSVLEIESGTQGVLMPRLQLSASANPAPLSAHIAGMTIYNTATAADVTPGFYYNDGTKWVKFAQNFITLNGLSYTPTNEIKLGGVLVQPTTIAASNTNTLALTGLSPGNAATDEIVTIDPTTGVLKKAPVSSLLKEKQMVFVSANGQTQFPTPFPITDIDKINVYRNGARIGATVVNPGTIALEAGVVCVAGDEIRIVQFN